MMKQSAEKTTSKNAVKTVIPSIWRTAGGKYSLIMLAIWLVVSAISLVWTPYSLLDTDGFNTWASPSGAHMLGTDGVGADVLSWLMAGSRTNLAIALLTVVVAAAIGLLLVARWLESRARERAAAGLGNSMARLPEAADRLRADGTFITIRLSNQESLDSVLKALDLIVPVSVHRQGPSVRLSAK